MSIPSFNQVQIGSIARLSQRAYLCTATHEFGEPTFNLITKAITIGDRCWIGPNAFVGPGVIMQDESRCLAGAVVVGSVDAGEVVGGVPAKPLGRT